MNQQEKFEKFNKAWGLKKQGKLKDALDLYMSLYDELIKEAAEYAGSIPGTEITDGKTVTMMPSFMTEAEKFLKREKLACTILNNMGVIYAEVGDKESARNCFEQSIELTPDGVDYPNPKIGLKELDKL